MGDGVPSTTAVRPQAPNSSEPGASPSLTVPAPAAHNQCGDYFEVANDFQVAETLTRTLIRSSTLTNNGPPGIRLPASELASPTMHEYLAGQYASAIPDPCRGFNRGALILGDIGDTGTQREIQYFMEAQKRVEAENDSNRLASVAPGNHDSFPNGTFNSGEAFGGIISIFFNLGRHRDYINNVAVLEAGEKGNLLNKRSFTQKVYDYYKLPWNPVKLAEATASDFRLQGEGSVEWYQTDRAASTFWKPTADGKNWHALIEFKPDRSDLNAEEQWLHLHAFEMGNYQTTVGNVPVYFIAVDTTDFLEDSSTDGAINGHISYIQTRVIQSFMHKMRKENPNAKFILGTHYPMDDVDHPFFSKWNLFDEILSDESVIAVLVGHTHRWNYRDLNSEDLAQELKIKGRRTPLPEINGPSLIDNPIGAASLRLHAEGSRLVLDYTKVTVDQEALRAKASADVQDELKYYDRFALTYERAWKNIRDRSIRFMSHVRGEFTDKVGVLADFDYGLLYEPGKVNDQIIARDTIPSMVEVANSRMRLYMSSAKLALGDAGLDAVTAPLNENFRKHLDNLYDYYQRSLTRHSGPPVHLDSGITGESFKMPQSASPESEQAVEIDRYTEPLGRAFVGVLSAVEARTAAETDPQKLETLKKLDRIVRDLYSITNQYKAWLMDYEVALAAHRPDEELSSFSQLMAPIYWQRLEQTFRSLPAKSSVHTFDILASLRAAELRDQFLRKTEGKKVPDSIHYSLDLSTNRVEMTKPPESIPDAGQERQLESYPQFAGSDDASLKRATVDLKLPKAMGHWVARTGIWAISQPNTPALQPNIPSFQGMTIHAGYQGHLFLGPLTQGRPGLFRLTGVATGDVYTDGPHGTETTLTTAAMFDALGHFALGPAGRGGVAYGNRGRGGGITPLFGGGLQVEAYEGAFYGNAIYNHYGNSTGEHSLEAGVDVFALGRLLGFLSRDF